MAESDNQVDKWLKSAVRVVNVGLRGFADDLESSRTPVTHVEWTPPAVSDPKVAALLGKMEFDTDADFSLPGAIAEANAEAHRRVLAADPVLVDVGLARDVLKGLPERVILHAGPPITWDRMCGPMQGAVLGAIVFEGWAKDLEEAAQVAQSGSIPFEPNHHYDAVGPMTGMTTPSMPVFIVENRAFGNRAYCTINEGMGNVMRFGGNDQEVVDRLKWMAKVVGPAFAAAIRSTGGIGLKNIIARGLSMGDEMHMRNAACSSLILRELAAPLAEVVESREELARLLRFISGNDMFFLNIVMAMAKSVIMPAHGVKYSTMVTTMARNGTDFGIRISSTGDQWFTGQAEIAEGLLFAGFTEEDANRDIGDSCITETIGLGGFAMAASPAVVGFVGAGTLADAIGYTRSMGEITIGQNPEWSLPTMEMAGVPTGIDTRKVLQTGLKPVINTAITNKRAGRGQIGAGVVHAPMVCFEKALVAYAEKHGVV